MFTWCSSTWVARFSTTCESIKGTEDQTGCLWTKSSQSWNKFWQHWRSFTIVDTSTGIWNQRICFTKMGRSRSLTSVFPRSTRGTRTILIMFQRGGIEHQKSCLGRRITKLWLMYSPQAAFSLSYLRVSPSFLAPPKQTCCTACHVYSAACLKVGSRATTSLPGLVWQTCPAAWSNQTATWSWRVCQTWCRSLALKPST